MAVDAQQIVKSKGEAVGKLTGVSHIAMMCKDMNATIRFYRDVLGLTIIATSGPAPVNRLDTGAPIFRRQYYMEMSNGDGVTFYEIPDSPDARDAAPPIGNIWPGETDNPAEPCKFDHLAFSVASREDVDWFANHLTKNGVAVSGPFGLTDQKTLYGDRQATPFTYRLYFWDPSGNPLEISSSEREPDTSRYFLDEELVPVALED